MSEAAGGLANLCKADDPTSPWTLCHPRNPRQERSVANSRTTTRTAARDYKIWQVIAASAVGTMIEWYDFYIFGSLATRHLAAVLSAGQRHAGADRLPVDVCRRLRGPAVRRAVLRPHRRSGRAEVRVPRHAADHGRRDGADRRAADLRDDRHRRADHPARSSASCRDSRSAASTAAPPSMSPSTCPTASAASTRASSRSPPRSACSCRWPSS